MRVLHIGKFFPPDAGGMETFLADLVAAQRAQGLEVSALVHGNSRAGDPEWLVRVPVTRTLVYAPIAPGFRRALAQMIRRFRPDILHLHLPNNSALWALSLRSARDLSWVVHWHSDVVVSPIRRAVTLAYRAYRPFEQAMLERAETVIATSPDYLEASEPLQRWRDKCEVIPLGINLAPMQKPQRRDAANDLPWPEGNFRLLSVGRLTYYKGFETLIRAVAVMPDVHLVVVGDGEQRDELLRTVRTVTPATSPARTTLMGALGDAEKHRLLDACDAFCLASCERTEAFGIAVMEAMAHGKPSLVSELSGSGLPWLIRSSGAGTTVPVSDVPAWQRAIAAAKKDAQQRISWGNAARAAVHDRFTIRGCADAVLRTYNAIVPQHFFPAQQPLVVLPARDEAATIGAVIASLRALDWQHIVVVNDQSCDETEAIARAAGATVLSPVLPLGAWGAMQTGIRYALRHGYQQVVTIDADGQHEPRYIQALLQAAQDHDVVIGAHVERGSLARKIAWGYFRAITGFSIRDLTSGFRCYNHAACQVLADEEATLLDYQDLGVLLMLRHAGMRITEVPVEMYPRVTGPSRIFASWSRVARYMVESSLLCLARWHPKHHFGR